MSAEIEEQRVVLVTGFGPFEGFPINFSWETVKLLPSFDWPSNVKVITHQIPVVYDIVLTKVPQLWEEIKPDLVIHTGVDGGANRICIENQSFNNEFCYEDITNKCPTYGRCKQNGAECLKTKLNVKKLCEETNKLCNEKNLNSRCIESNDPGRYLCGFIYYVSLSEDNSKSLFVHVPPEHVYKTEDMAQALKSIILECLKQLS